MRAQTRQAYHRCILRVIEHVLHAPDRRLPVAQVATSAGFSRYHLNRLFSAEVGESLGAFARRIRLERAACLLQTTPLPITQIAYDTGYANAEVFSRAFHAAFALSPSAYRRQLQSWQLPCASGVHWQENPTEAVFSPDIADSVPVRIVTRPGVLVAVRRYVGDYTDIARAWEHLRTSLPGRPWEKTGSRLLTLYHDDGKAASDRMSLRADIGFTIDKNETPPEGMRILALPGGQFAQTSLRIGPQQHSRGWDYMNTTYIPKTRRRPKNIPGIDEYQSLPVPWSQLRARILIGLEIDLGDT